MNNGDDIKYNYLVVASGVKMNFDVVDGLSPADNRIQNIVIPKLANKIRDLRN
ncbi:MAG: hypothetical protein AAF731_00035 [Bacteroidota bacterium]